MAKFLTGQIDWRRVLILPGIIKGILVVGSLDLKFWVSKKVVESDLQSELKLRIFEIKGERGAVSPVSFRAYQKVNKGEAKTIEFPALNPGDYNFYCSLYQTKDKSTGKVIVLSK